MVLVSPTNFANMRCITLYIFWFHILALVSPGLKGQVAESYLQEADLGHSAKDKYPLVLIKLMTRYAEDLVWADKVPEAEAVFTFIVSLTEGREEAPELRKCRFISRNTVI